MARLAVVTMAIGDPGRALHRLTGPVMARYADRIGAEFRVIKGDASPLYPMANKLHLASILARRDRVIYLDADCIVAPDCPDLCELVPATHFGVYDEWPNMAATGQGRGWLDAERKALAASQGWADPGTDTPCVNAGVMVASRGHAGVFTSFSREFPITHCAEQHAIALALHRRNVPLYNLTETYNYQWWCHKDTHAEARPMIAHYSGMSPSAGGPGDAAREALIRARVEELYPGLLPDAGDEPGCRWRADHRRTGQGLDAYICTNPGHQRHGLPVLHCSLAAPAERCGPLWCDHYAPGID